MLELSVDQILNEARAKERAYDWSGAAELYNKALGLVSEPTESAKAALTEDLAYATFRWARQAENRPEFVARMKTALTSFDTARQFYLRLGQAQSPLSLRGAALIAFLSVWLASDPAEKTRLLDDSWIMTKRALKGFEESDEPVEYARTFDQLSRGVILRVEFEWSFPARRRIIREFLKYGDKAVALVSSLEDLYQITRTTAGTAVCFAYFAELMLGTEVGKELERKALSYWLRAKKLNEKVALLELAHLGFGPAKGNLNAADWLKASEYARASRDNLLHGWTLDMLAMCGLPGESSVNEDADEMARQSVRVLKYAEEARQHYTSINFKSPLPSDTWTGANSPEHYWRVSFWEADLKKKRILLEKSRELLPGAVNEALKSGYPTIIAQEYGAYSKTLGDLACLEPDSAQRKRLLKDALRHETEAYRIDEQIFPFHPAYHGSHYIVQASLKADLAEHFEKTKTRKRLLQDAAKDVEAGVRLWVGADWPGVIHSCCGGILSALYSVTKKPRDLRKAVNAYTKAADFFRGADLPSHVAECYWRIALARDALDENRKASESFQLASDSYKFAAQKISQLSQFYLDYSRYMRAWREIEKAKYHHSREEYGLAKASYKSAARIHQSTSRWSYLSSNYSAWAWLEDAEDLSRRERSQEAVLAFQRAASRFRDSSRLLKLVASKIESKEEMRIVLNLQTATAPREAYCNARIRIEEAKLLDRKGEHEASSKGYDEAIEMLENLIPTLESKDEREIRLILTLAEAWQIMARAEEEMSPGHFLQAAKFFEKAKELSSNERTRLLVSGHIHLCRALHASAHFASTGKIAFYSSATRQLELASNYYVNSNFTTAVSFSKATEQLLDAYSHMIRAKRERDQGKKAKLYLLAERLLRGSARNYGEGEQLARKARVERLLDRAIEERELALSLTALLSAPTTLSSTAAFRAPSATEEKAVGPNGFEHANIHAQIRCDKRILRKGDGVEVQLELGNAGKTPAQLVRWEDVIPERFELVEQPVGFQLADRSLDMKGWVLAPLKTHSVRLVLRATDQGISVLRPHIVYLGAEGDERTIEPEPVDIIVSPILEYLARCYREDYDVREMSSGEVGWRSLMDIVQAQDIPQSQVYGDPRRGKTFAKPLENLVDEGLVEVRVFSGERGRGGRVVKVRMNYMQERARRLVKVSQIST